MSGERLSPEQAIRVRRRIAADETSLIEGAVLARYADNPLAQQTAKDILVDIQATHERDAIIIKRDGRIFGRKYQDVEAEVVADQNAKNEQRKSSESRQREKEVWKAKIVGELLTEPSVASEAGWRAVPIPADVTFSEKAHVSSQISSERTDQTSLDRRGCSTDIYLSNGLYKANTQIGCGFEVDKDTGEQFAVLQIWKGQVHAMQLNQRRSLTSESKHQFGAKFGLQNVTSNDQSVKYYQIAASGSTPEFFDLTELSVATQLPSIEIPRIPDYKPKK